MASAVSRCFSALADDGLLTSRPSSASAEKQRLTAEAMCRQEPMIYVAELRLAIDLVNLTCCGGLGTDTSREALNLALARKVNGFYRVIDVIVTTARRQRRNLRL